MERTVSIQAVLYEAEAASLQIFIECLANLRVPQSYRFQLRIGDCSAQPVDQQTLSSWRTLFSSASIELTYVHFGANIGFGGGHNRLADDSSSDFVLLINPDTAFSSDLVQTLLSFVESRPDCGIVEARQYPLEHPKHWNTSDGTTEWCSCCCALVPGNVFRQVGGFDESFFLYCEDVDISWRIRATGKKAYFSAEASIYHRKQLSLTGITTSQSESIWGVVSHLLLLQKYGKSRSLADMIDLLQSGKEERFCDILTKYHEAKNLLQPASTAERAVARFDKTGNPSFNRWCY